MNEEIINLLHNSRNTIKKLLKVIDDTTFIPLITVKEVINIAENNVAEIEKILDTYYSINIEEKKEKE